MRTYDPNQDPYLKKYPVATLLKKCTPGYGYEFGKFHIIKNMTGTGGWILVLKHEEKSRAYPFALDFDEAVKIGEEKTRV